MSNSAYLHRLASEKVAKMLQIFPAVVLLGSRQCGKSTLVKMMSESFERFLYLDLQDRRDLSKLADPPLFFEHNRDYTICLDEIQRQPDLFNYLRSEIDNHRVPGRFILLGSASPELIQHTSETLAGRVGMVDLSPFNIMEVASYPTYNRDAFWLRGGYPDSYLAINDEASALWRENYIRTYIERDIPQLGFSLAAPKMLRLLTMLAHEHGSILNNTKLATSMDMSAPTIRHYIDIMEQTYIVRVLPPYYTNIKKRLTKSPKVYIRDTGLLHQLLNIPTFNDLLSHSVVGLSWESCVIENVCSVIHGAQVSYYRSADGKEEMDLIVEYPNKLIAIECKSATAPQLTVGFWKSLDTLHPQHTYVVAPIADHYPLREDVEVIGLYELCKLLQNE